MMYNDESMELGLVTPGLETDFNSSPSIAAATTAGLPNDDCRDDSLQSPSDGERGVPQITQDEDPQPEILDAVSHQLQRVAESSMDDGHFDSIIGHEWQDGILLFCVKWRTDETSLLPFSVVKRDFLMETAKYILANRIAQTESYSTGGRYTRWARQFTRQLNRIVRRILRHSNGVLNADSRHSALQVASHLPNGTRLIRRTISTATKIQGARKKRRKHGRISRPVQVKYGVVVPKSVKQALELD